MTGPSGRSPSRAGALWLAVGICLSLAAVFIVTFRIVVQWQATADSLSRRRAEESASLLATALLRDMRGVHEGVLTSSRLVTFVLQSPYAVRSDVATAFARYPYPESFFTWHRGMAPADLTFFNRGSRRPAWMPEVAAVNRGPVTIESAATVARVLFDRIAVDIAARHRVSVFETSIGGVRYQVVAQLIYRDLVQEDLEAIVGFTVNLPWARANYFPEITEQVGRIAGIQSPSNLALRDQQGTLVFGSAPRPPTATVRRTVPLLFVDPLLLAAPPADLAVQPWSIDVAVEQDAALAAATSITKRALVIAGLAAAVLCLGLILSVRAARASAELSRLRSDFVSTVTHEIKTPIASIRTIGDTLVSGRATGEVFQECANLLVQESRRLTRLVDNLLAYSRITDVTEAYQFESLELEQVVGEALEGFHWQLRDLGFSVDVRIPAETPPVRGDRTALRLAFDNVVDNAIRYSGDRRQLVVTAASATPVVHVDIADQGRGISADDLPFITRRFFRGRGAKATGSGLGLTIVDRIVADHGGRLGVTSELGRGTTVRITLPQGKTDDGEANSGRRG